MNVKQTYRNLRQWLIGEANYHDEQQLLRQATDDPFLAEALEGYETMPEGEHAQRVARIKEAVNARTSQKRRGIVYWPRIAAAVLFLCVAGVAFWWVNKDGGDVLADQMKTETEEVTNTESIPEKKETAVIEKDNSSTEDSFSEEVEESEAEVARILPDEEAINQSTQKESIGEPKPIQDDVPAVTQDNEVRVTPYNDGVPIDRGRAETLDEFSDTEGAEPAAKKDNPFIAEEPSSAPPVSPQPGMLDTQLDDLSEAEAIATYAYGQVVDQSTGEPLIAASVRIPGGEEGTLTNIDGFFALPVREEKTEIEISYTGYESMRQFVRAGDTLAFELSVGDMLLDEVVVTGLETRSKRSKSNASIDVIPEPKMGMKRFQRYIDRNLKYPEAARDADISGEVILSFGVDENKRPEAIQVEQSLGYGCDQEAIRLLKEGPDWKAGTQRGTITINFK
ncbi:MAG: TonB family protein [Chitinophagales bacterium]|nr:TonB family protein [Chitinophagales bacterium]